MAGGPASGWESQLEDLAGGIGAAIIFPSALQYAGQFWGIHNRYQVLDRLANGFGSNSGEYRFAR
jgi:hypothetical protein